MSMKILELGITNHTRREVASLYRKNNSWKTLAQKVVHAFMSQ